MLQRRRDDSIKGLVEPDLTRVKRAIEKETADFTIIREEADQLRKEWLPVYKYDLPSLQDALKTVLKAKADLGSLDLDQLKAQNEALRQTRHYIADSNLERAEEAMTKLGRSPARQISKQVSEVRTQISQLKSEASRNKAKERIYGKTATTAVPNFGAPPAGSPDRIKEAEAMANEGKTAASAELDKAGKASLEAEAKAKPGAKAAKEEEVKKSGRTPKASYNYTKGGEEEEEEGTSIFVYLGVLALLGLGGFLWMQKKKQNQG